MSILSHLSVGLPGNKNICGSADTSSNIIGSNLDNNPEHLNDLELAKEDGTPG